MALSEEQKDIRTVNNWWFGLDIGKRIKLQERYFPKLSYDIVGFSLHYVKQMYDGERKAEKKVTT